MPAFSRVQLMAENFFNSSSHRVNFIIFHCPTAKQLVLSLGKKKTRQTYTHFKVTHTDTHTVTHTYTSLPQADVLSLPRDCYWVGCWKCRGAKELSIVSFLATGCLFSNSDSDPYSSLPAGTYSLLLLRLDRLLYPSPQLWNPLESSREFHNIRETGSAWSFLVSLFPFPWVVLCLLRVSMSFRSSVKTGANITWPWYRTPILSLLWKAGVKLQMDSNWMLLELTREPQERKNCS